MSKLWCNLCSKCYAMDCFGTTWLTWHTLHTSWLATWGGVGWGGGVGCNDMHCTCTHIRYYAIALAHMFDATQLHLRTCSMLRNCTCAHVRCYAIALARMLAATQLHLHTCPRSCPKHISVAYSKCHFEEPARGMLACYPYNLRREGQAMDTVLNSCVWTRICPSSSSSNT